MAHYYRIDVTDPNEESNGFSLCVKSNEDIGEDNVIDYAVKADLIDKWDVKENFVNVEEITDDEYEMGHWEKYAVEV